MDAGWPGSIASGQPTTLHKWCDDEKSRAHCLWGTKVSVVGYVDRDGKDIGPIDPEIGWHKTKRLDALRAFSRLREKIPTTGGVVKNMAYVKVRTMDNEEHVVDTKVVFKIRYPSLQVSGVPDSIDPDGNTDLSTA